MKDYRVRTACEVLGVWRQTGEIIQLSDAQAMHLAPPHGRVVLPYEGKPADADTTEQKDAADGGLDGRGRAKRKAAE